MWQTTQCTILDADILRVSFSQVPVHPVESLRDPSVRPSALSANGQMRGVPTTNVASNQTLVLDVVFDLSLELHLDLEVDQRVFGFGR